MWTTEYTAETDIPPHGVWIALREIHIGATPAPGGDTFEIHGPYEVGTQLSVTPSGQDTFRSEIVELVEDERYADRTEFGNVILTFRHALVPTDRGTKVTHELVIDGPGADTVGPELGPQISADFPTAMEGLFEVAAQAHASGGQ